MIIGIDFDNTIINYEQLFASQAIKNAWLSDDSLSKKEVKQALIDKFGDDLKWQILQAEIYGETIAKAKPYAGVIKFIQAAISSGTIVYIVSHKTEFSNFDGKTNLIKPAIQWLNDHNIIGDSGLIPASHVSYHATRTDKINKINELNCDIFIDDLSEVLLNPQFPVQTTPIHFLPELYPQLMDHKLITVDKWSAIQKFYLLAKQYDLLWLIELSQLKQSLVVSISADCSGGNNFLQLVQFNNKEKCFLKRCIAEKLSYLKNECMALELLNKYKVKGVALILSFSEKRAELVQSYLPGKHVKNISNDHINKVIDFILSLDKLEQSEINYTNICDNRNSLNDYSHSINQRWRLMNKDIKSLAEKHSILKKVSILLQQIKPLKDKVLEQFERQIEQYHLDTKKLFSDQEKIFNPSDFGFHNMLEGQDKTLYFLDFEYFVYDDKAKMVCDFIHHQGHKLSLEQKLYFIIRLNNNNFFTQELKQRVSILINMVGFEWLLIILNITQKDKLQQKIHANPDKTVAQIIETQYNKAKNLFEFFQQNEENNKVLFTLGIDKRELGFD